MDAPSADIEPSLDRAAGTQAPVHGRFVAMAIALAILTFILYWPALGNGFVAYDDGDYVTTNTHVRAGLSWSNVRWAFTTTDVSNWHPLTWLSYMTDAELFGVRAAAFHFTNVLVHAINAALLFWLLLRATGWWVPSLIVALLFAVHPLNVQSVAWVSERKNVLSTAFWLLAMLAYVDWTRRPRPLAYAAVVGSLMLSLLSKPMAVTLPFVLLLFDYWPLGRWTLGIRRLTLEKAPLFAIVAAFCFVTYRVQAAGGSVIAEASIPTGIRLGNAVWSYVAYLGKALRPAGLAVFYPYATPPLPFWQIAMALAALTAVTAAAYVFRQRARPILMGWLWYLGTLVPVIGIVQVGSQAMADRYAYVPLIGIFIACAWGASLLVRNGLLPKAVAIGAAVVLVSALSLRTVRQIAVWRTTQTLFEHTVRVEPDSWVAHYNLGVEANRTGRYDDAVARFRETIRLSPNFADAYNGLGSVLASRGHTDEAIANYQRALTLKPRLAAAHNNLGIALVAKGEVDAGIDHLRQALAAEPGFNDARINLSMTLRRQKRFDEALAEINRVMQAMPRSPIVRYQRGVTLFQMGDVDGARADLKALEATAPAAAGQLKAVLDGRSDGR
jgi:Flp pilus assembly protein TadD